jgi:hypothetical protein
MLELLVLALDVPALAATLLELDPNDMGRARAKHVTAPAETAH